MCPNFKSSGESNSPDIWYFSGLKAPTYFPHKSQKVKSESWLPCSILFFHEALQMLSRFPVLSVIRTSSQAKILLHFFTSEKCMAPHASLPIPCMGSQQFCSLEQRPVAHLFPSLFFLGGRGGPWLAPIYPGRGYFPSLPAMRYFMEAERRKPSLCLLLVALVLFFPLFSQKPFSLDLTWLSPPRQAQRGFIYVLAPHSCRVPRALWLEMICAGNSASLPFNHSHTQTQGILPHSPGGRKEPPSVWQGLPKWEGEWWVYSPGKML